MKRRIRSENENILNQLDMLKGVEFDRDGKDLIVLTSGLLKPESIKVEDANTFTATTTAGDKVVIKTKTFFDGKINDLKIRIESIKSLSKKNTHQPRLGEDFYEV